MNATIITAVNNQVLSAHYANEKNSELKAKTREIIMLAIAESMKHVDFIPTMKEIYVNHNSWPSHNGKKVGENSARKSSAGKGFNSLASLFRQLFTTTEDGLIREKTKEEKAPKKKAEVTDDAPEATEEMPLAAKAVSIDDMSIEQIAGILLAKCNNDKKAAKKAIDTVAKG